MNETVSCFLEIGGLIHEDDLPDLAAAIDEEDHLEGTALEVLNSKTSNNLFSFTGVQFGVIPDGIADALARFNISYAWQNDSGVGIESAVALQDAASGEKALYASAEGFIMLSIKAAENPLELKKAKAWESFQARLSLTISRSAHERIAMLKTPRAKAFLYETPE